MIKNNKKGWIKIVEAFIAILLIAGVLLMVINKGYSEKEDISMKVYTSELQILREIQQDLDLRDEILDLDEELLPIRWEDNDFPLNLKNNIISRIPNYLNCEAKICATNDPCFFDKTIDGDVFVRDITITTNLTTYSPKQLKLFCWTD